MAVDSGSYTDATLESRRRLAEAMMRQSVDTSPIQHHTQGLARLANALFGGIALNDLDTQSRERDKEYADTLLKTLDGTTGATPAPAKPAATVAAATPATGNLTDFIKGREGFSAKPYPDFKQTSSGYGTVAQPGDGDLSPEEADKRLNVEVGKARQLVQSFGAKLTPAQEDALTDLTYNAGTKWMNSGLGEAVKAGDWNRAAELFRQYNKAGGEVQPGLVARREALAGNLTGNASNSTVQGDPAQPQQVTGSAQTGATGVPTGSGTQNGINPQVRARVEALIRSPDRRARAMGEKLVATLVSQGVKPTELGLTPIYGTDKDGNPVIGQMSPTGEIVRSKTPADFKPSTGIEKLDAGTHWIIKDKRTGQTIGTEKKDIVGKEAAEERGKELGKAQVDLPRVENNAKSTLKYIDAVLNDPNLGNVTGWQNWIPGNKDIPWNADTVARVDQLKGKAFLEAFNSLKGAGQITEVEGAKATDALARLTNMNQTDEGYKQALEDFKTEVKALVEVARQKAGQGSKAQGTATQTPGAPRVREYNPATGKIE